MDAPENNPKTTEPTLATALLEYYDEFAAFNEDCAFLCDAFSCLVANSEIMNQHSIHGMQSHADWLKRKVSEFKEQLQQIRELHSAAND